MKLSSLTRFRTSRCPSVVNSSKSVSSNLEFSSRSLCSGVSKVGSFLSIPCWCCERASARANAAWACCSADAWSSFSPEISTNNSCAVVITSDIPSSSVLSAPLSSASRYFSCARNKIRFTPSTSICICRIQAGVHKKVLGCSPPVSAKRMRSTGMPR